MKYEEITIGDAALFERAITVEMVDQFAALSGDQNPLHMNEVYAHKTEFGGRVVHGMLLGSLFSTLVGMHLPGESALYLSQDLRFHHPLHPGGTVTVTGEVTAKSDATRIIEMATTIKDERGTLLVSGVARVKVRQ